MTRLPSIALLVSFLVTTPLSITPARAADVDLALVLAVDVSSSVNEDRYQLQMRGFAQAFRSPDVIGAIQQGPQGAIAVTLVQWASYGDYRQVVDWTIIRDRTSASQFADAVVETFRALEGSTSLSGAIDVSVTLLQSSGHNARWKVIDISGDGSNNSGRPAGDARDDAVAAGITINGLPILTEKPTLGAYFRDNVIGGPNAFLVVADNLEAFSTAILLKLTTEIAGSDLDTQHVMMLQRYDASFD
jgi:hypothetical protein